MSERTPCRAPASGAPCCASATPARSAELAAEMEGLGYSALWIPDIGGDVSDAARRTCSAATHDGDDRHRHPQHLDAHAGGDGRAARRARRREHGHRFLCGIGVSHRPFIDHVNEPGTYQKPVAKMAEFLDGLDAAAAAAGRGASACIAALGPKMLELAAARTSGTHPYLVTPEHTATAREAVGPDALVASEQARRARHRPDDGAGDGPHPPQDVPRAAQLHEQLEAHRASPTTTSPTAAATASSTPSWRGATRTPSSPGSRRTATPAPTTSASRPSSTTRARCPPASGAPSPRRSSEGPSECVRCGGGSRRRRTRMHEHSDGGPTSDVSVRVRSVPALRRAGRRGSTRWPPPTRSWSPSRRTGAATRAAS